MKQTSIEFDSEAERLQFLELMITFLEVEPAVEIEVPTFGSPFKFHITKVTVEQ